MEKIDGNFKFFMPIQKDIEGDPDKPYHIKLGVASGLRDKQGDKFSERFLNTMVTQLNDGLTLDGSKVLPLDDNHKNGLKSTVGVAKSAWIEDNKVFADFEVVDDWKSTVKGLLKAGAKLGGSVKGKATAKNDVGELDDGFLAKIALTDTPAQWDLRGTAEECTMCTQIQKTLEFEKSWDGSKSRFSDEQYKKSALWCDPKVAAGTMSAKEGCHLPVRDPDGKLNPDGVEAAYGALQGARNSPDMPASAKASALSKLKGYYTQLGLKGLGPLKKTLEIAELDESFELLEKALDDNDVDIDKVRPQVEEVAKGLLDVIKDILHEEE